jgi:agmatinase
MTGDATRRGVAVSPVKSPGRGRRPPRHPGGTRPQLAYASDTQFAGLPTLDESGPCAVAILGVPFDSGTSYRPGARFGPMAVRQAARRLSAYHPGYQTQPFTSHRVADAGDVFCTPYNIRQALRQIGAGAELALEQAQKLISLGGDHTIALPLMRAVSKKYGQLAVVHFDAHLDTWKSSSMASAPYTHGTPFRRAAEEGLLADNRSIHIGTRSSLTGPADLREDAALGFEVAPATDFDTRTPAQIAAQIVDRVGGMPVYLSIDIDVLDPAYAPGTGTPEAFGLTSRELAATLKGLAGIEIASADIVEVSPPFDSGETTSLVAAQIAYDILALLAL